MIKMRSCNGYKTIVCMLVLVTLLSGCSKAGNLEKDTKGDENKNTYHSDYEVGVIKTTPERVGTDIIYLDSNLQEIRTLNYPYGNMRGCGFYVPKIVNGVMYEDPLGFGHEKDFGTIIGLDLQNGEVKEYKLIYDLKQWFDPDVKGVIFPLVYHDMLYLPVNNKVIEYDIKNNTFSEITIPHNEARQLLVHNEKLYVSSTDVHDENTESAIVVLDLKTKKVIGDIQLSHNIMQFDVKGEQLYILTSGDVFGKYKLDNTYQATLEKKVELEAGTKDGHFYYISSFFVK